MSRVNVVRTVRRRTGNVCGLLWFGDLMMPVRLQRVFFVLHGQRTSFHGKGSKHLPEAMFFAVGLKETVQRGSRR